MADGRHHVPEEEGNDDIYVPPPRDVPAPLAHNEEPTAVAAGPRSPWAPPELVDEAETSVVDDPDTWLPPRRAPVERPVDPSPPMLYGQLMYGQSGATRNRPSLGRQSFGQRRTSFVAPSSPAPAAVSPSGSHESEPRRRGWWFVAGAIVLAVAVTGGVLVGVRLAERQSSGGSGAGAGTCDGRPILRVAVAPEFAPVVEIAAEQLASGGCQPVTVAAQDPAATVADLGKRQPDAWVPSSSAWLKLASASGSTFAENPVSLARTPIVVAAPKPFAESIGWPAKQPSWAELTTGVAARKIPRFSMASPLQSTASLLAVLEVTSAMARTTPDPGIAQMRALTLRARLADADADLATLVRRMGQQTDPAKAVQDVGLFPLTEQALWAYDRNDHPVPLAALYPSDALLEADYPLVLTQRTAGDPGRRDLTNRLTERLRSREFVAQLTEHGFRPAAQSAASTGTASATAPSGPGLVARYESPVTMPAQVAETAGLWARYKRLTYQTLLLVDGSGSMNDPVRDRSGKTTTKAELLRLAGVQAAQLFGEDTSLGMWLFGTPSATSPPYVEVLPFGPINESINGVPRRDVMRGIAASYKAYPQAGTPLYETVLRGVADMRKRYQPDTITMVVVLTDGHDQDSRFAMTREQFLARLSAERDPARPVPVFAIGYGADADMAVLTQMATITGGRAAASNDPSDLASAMAKIFLAAHAAQ
jgi:Ca-activated chloride channel homolog